MPRKHYIRPILTLLVVFNLLSCGVNKSLNDKPDISIYNSRISDINRINDSTAFIGNNFLTKNKLGLWELYVEGDPYERGLAIGSLTKPLMDKQESIFLNKVKEMVPSEGRQKFLKKFLAWYNRKMHKNIPEEYKAEIYGVSRFASDEFNSLAPPYLRALYLHSAHDIGHALQDLALVGCTSFAAWDDKTEDGQLLLGRNFDFYAGDAFAEEKIIAFINPDRGHKFMSVTWGGMVGVVSGMNDQGLTVTINAGKSKIPLVAKTPISIVTREILQYASNIEEAIAIAKKRDVFVSESIMVGSSTDGRAVLIEVSPNDFGVYRVANRKQLICSNHFQSEPYKNDRRNLKTIKESHTQYRYDRMSQLLAEEEKLNVAKAVKILRNKEGLNGIALGLGNEKAINQLLAHHGIVFKPEELQVWISTNPYQMGEFVAYDLNEVFRTDHHSTKFAQLSSSKLNIPKDPFIYSESFTNYEAYRQLERRIEQALEADLDISEEDLGDLENLNPEFWKGYFLVGKYYFNMKQYQKALEYFNQANNREVSTLEEEEELKKFIKKSKRKAKK